MSRGLIVGTHTDSLISLLALKFIMLLQRNRGIHLKIAVSSHLIKSFNFKLDRKVLNNMPLQNTPCSCRYQTFACHYHAS